MTSPLHTLTMVPHMATPRRANGLAAQIRHLLRFDVLRLRWWLVAYAVILGIAVMHALEVPGIMGVSSVVLAFGVPGFTMLCAVVLVQGDHPTASDAFWRGKPVAPWAQVGAKLLVLAALVALPALAIAGALAAIGTPLVTVGLLVRASAWGLLPWAVLALAIGTVTRDLRSAPLVLVAALVLALSTRAFGGLAGFGPAWLADVEAWGVIVGGIAMVAALYHGAVGARPALAVTVLLGVTAMDASTRAITVLGQAPPLTVAGIASTTNDTPEERLVIDTLTTGDLGDGPFALTYSVANARPDARYSVRGALVTLHYADGDTARLSMVDGGLVEPARSALPVPAGTRWSASAFDSLPQPGTMVAFIMSRDAARRPASDIRRIEVRGSLRRMLVRDTLSVPWTTGGLSVGPGQRLQLLDTIATGGVRWRLRRTEPRVMADAERERYGDWPDDLVNTSLVRIDRAQVAHTIGRQLVDHRSDPFVLPWVVRREETLWLGARAVLKAHGIPNDVGGSRLHVVRWQTAAVVPVQAEHRMGVGREHTP